MVAAHYDTAPEWKPLALDLLHILEGTDTEDDLTDHAPPPNYKASQATPTPAPPAPDGGAPVEAVVEPPVQAAVEVPADPTGAGAQVPQPAEPSVQATESDGGGGSRAQPLSA
jgi:hypothetical protein